MRQIRLQIKSVTPCSELNKVLVQVESGVEVPQSSMDVLQGLDLLIRESQELAYELRKSKSCSYDPKKEYVYVSSEEQERLDRRRYYEERGIQ